MMRTRCHLFGCCEAEDAPCCFRCAAYIYDPEFIEFGRGWLTPLRRRWWWLLAWSWPRCQSCGKRLWPWTPRYKDDFCAKSCFDQWVPF